MIKITSRILKTTSKKMNKNFNLEIEIGQSTTMLTAIDQTTSRSTIKRVRLVTKFMYWQGAGARWANMYWQGAGARWAKSVMYLA